MTDQITGGDLYHLWRVSDVHLPRIADVYYDANRRLSGAKTTVTPIWGAPADKASDVSKDSDAFRDNVSAYPGSSVGASSVGAAWAQLRDELQSMYTQIGTTILSAAEGIRKATRDFVDADQASADAPTKYIHNPINHNLNDPASNPPAPGADDDPGKPVLPS